MSSAPPCPVVVATDGSSLGNPGPTGWAWWASSTSWAAGTLGRGTNNAAELSALLQVLRAVPGDLPLQVRTDSTYVRDIMVGNGRSRPWRVGWAANGWRTRTGPVKNVELVRELDDLWRARSGPLSLHWVRAHQVGGDRHNAAADAHAQAAARAFKQGRPVPAGPGWCGS